ncbi:hypothetical protein F2Q70_00043836 [Brassica cretica]|uniref:Uncharacterized protein n=1 Tax=Brassica cretica TaxID=69181 RepID=A0A8S9KLW5_BRACR|nr:hypothetical protein F2Q70_00043836 [Brassica cretica]KAF3518413.1 hypothetical protein DY000_02061301 [Brassica cretica]
MANSFIFLATGTSLQGLSLFTLSITLNFGNHLLAIFDFKFFGFWKMTGFRGLAVFNILKAFSAAASKLETIRQVDAKNHNAPSETKPLIVHKLSHHFSFGIEFEVFKEDVFVENRTQHLILFFCAVDNTVSLRFMKTGKHVRFGVDYSTATWFYFNGVACSLVKEAGSLVNEVKWNIFGSSFSVLDSGLGFEIGDPSQRTLVGKAVKPTQNSISTSGAVNLRKVNRVRIGVQARVTKLLMQ